MLVAGEHKGKQVQTLLPSYADNLVIILLFCLSVMQVLSERTRKHNALSTHTVIM